MNDLKKYRIALNMTQDEASHYLGISRKNYIKYELMDNLEDGRLNYYIYKLKEKNHIDNPEPHTC